MRQTYHLRYRWLYLVRSAQEPSSSVCWVDVDFDSTQVLYMRICSIRYMRRCAGTAILVNYGKFKFNVRVHAYVYVLMIYAPSQVLGLWSLVQSRLQTIPYIL